MHTPSALPHAVPALLAVAVLLGACAGPGSSNPDASVLAPGATGDVPAALPAISVRFAPTVAGDVLVGPNGMTLYVRTDDHYGKSTCTSGPCASNWPALKGNVSQIGAGAGVYGVFGTTTWSNGTSQVTYNGQPLYYHKKDAATGDALGQGRGDVWFVIRAGAAPGCEAGAAPGQSAEPYEQFPAPAIHASQNSGGEY